MNKFIEPEYKIIYLNETDVIVTSGCNIGTGEEEDCLGNE